MRKQMKTSSERVWKQTRVKLVVRKKHSSSSFVFYYGLVGRWRESLGDRQICSVSIQRAGKGAGVLLGVLPWGASKPEQSHCGHLAIPSVGSEGFGGLLANSNLFQRIQLGGMPGPIAGASVL